MGGGLGESSEKQLPWILLGKTPNVTIGKWSASLWFLQFSEMPPVQLLCLLYYLNAQIEEAMVEEATWFSWRETPWYISQDKLSVLSLVDKAF